MIATRRAFVRGMAGAAAVSVIGRAHANTAETSTAAATYGFELDRELLPRPVLRSREVSGPAIVLLHELPGLSPADMKLGRRLANQGFTVYLPLLFGDVGQDSILRGYFQSCFTSEFECFASAKTSPAARHLLPLCDEVAEARPGPVGVIGMCLTGAFPLVLLGGKAVAAAVVCQPTLPFSAICFHPVGSQKSDLGLGPEDLGAAKQSSVPFLALRYEKDKKCPPERMRALADVFGDRVAVVEVPGCGHSTLAGSFDRDAFDDTVSYLRVRLRRESGPPRMRLAKLAGRACTIGPEGPWRAAE